MARGSLTIVVVVVVDILRGAVFVTVAHLQKQYRLFNIKSHKSCGIS